MDSGTDAGDYLMLSSPGPSFWRTLKVLSATAATVAFCALVIWGFVEGRNEAATEAERERPVKAALRVAKGEGEPVVTVDAVTRQRNGIETMRLMPAPYQEQVRAYVTVLDAARITDLSNAYASARAQLKTAAAKLASSKPEWERERSLYTDRKIVTLESVQNAEAAFRTDEATLATAESQVRTLTATAEQEWGPVLGKAIVDNSSVITRLIERKDFLLQVTVSPGASVAKPPPTAAIEVAGGSRAEMQFVSPATRTDPKIQSSSYFYLVAAESGVLPGMTIVAFLPVGLPSDGVSVPPEAVVWWQGRAWVYRETQPDSFTRAEIATDLPAPSGGYIVRTLPHDVQTVTGGAQSLLSEEFRAHIEVGEDKK